MKNAMKPAAVVLPGKTCAPLPLSCAIDECFPVTKSSRYFMADSASIPKARDRGVYVVRTTIYRLIRYLPCAKWQSKMLFILRFGRDIVEFGLAL
ncbi:hypothetical protein HYFRA_00011075 [Hymenoscyphus fraxineus]|uniref:Uncharacterized protein n=1 Tax=Hymenoscyphus fraxineus TaxID=746836 RepID=A0A9N9L5A1_9HELO|nr:hypothetical protein HYFRA_00011075 [Hymenoscyphus fraxineus]